MIRRLFVCPDLMRQPEGKRIMKSRRQFVIDNVAAWFLAPDLAKRIEWFSDHQEKPYLQTIKKPKVKLYAQWEDNYYHLTYGESREGDFLEEITWGDYFSDYVGIDPKDKKSILEWAEDAGYHYPNEGVFFTIPNPKDSVDDDLWEQYLDGNWSTWGCPSAQAFHYLSALDLGPNKPNESDQLGFLELTQCPHPGSSATYALAHCHSTLSCLQHRLLEIGEDAEIIVS